jgi:hypothetical protein
MSRRRGAPVVIVRKDKKIKHKVLHAFAFAATGGLSGVVTATEAANQAAYRARTRKLQADAEAEAPHRRPLTGQAYTAKEIADAQAVLGLTEDGTP